MEFRRQWLNYILRGSSELFYLKQRLLVVHGLPGFKLLVQVWVKELVLSIVSFPAFLFLHAVEVPTEHQQVYRVRRKITLLVLIPLLIVWFARVGLGMSEYIGSSLQEFSEGPAGNHTTVLLNTLSSARYYTRLGTPTLLISSSTMYIVSGHADPQLSIIVVFQQQDQKGGIYLMGAPTNEQGDWFLERTKVSSLPPGKYRVVATAYESQLSAKSLASPSIDITIDSTWWQKFERMTDYIIYGTIGLLVILAITVSFLTS